MRIALDEHQIAHLDRTVLAYPANVIAAKINEHHVLGAFFLVFEHGLRQERVFSFIAAAWTCARNRAIFELAAGGAHQHLRRRSQNMCISHSQKIHIRRRIYGAECPIDIEGGDFGREVQAQGKHDLKDIASGDVLFGAIY